MVDIGRVPPLSARPARDRLRRLRCTDTEPVGLGARQVGRPAHLLGVSVRARLARRRAGASPRFGESAGGPSLAVRGGSARQRPVHSAVRCEPDAMRTPPFSAPRQVVFAWRARHSLRCALPGPAPPRIAVPGKKVAAREVSIATAAGLGRARPTPTHLLGGAGVRVFRPSICMECQY